MKRSLSLLLLLGACGGGGGTSMPDAAAISPDAAAGSPDADERPATMNVTWNLVNAGNPASCPSGATSASIYAQPDGNVQPYVDIYDCSAGAGSSMNLPPGHYLFWVELTDTSGATLYAESESFGETLVGGDIASADF